MRTSTAGPAPVSRQSTWFIKIAGAIVVAAILLLLGFLQAQQFGEADELRKRIFQSFETRAQIEALLSTHQDIETGQRGYVLTGNASFLEPYEQARPRLAPQMERLEEGLGSNSRGNLEQLARLSREKLAFSDQVIRLRRQGRENEAARLIAAGRGKAVMDDIRSVIAAIDKAEQRQLEARMAQASAMRARNQALTYGLEALLLLLLLGAAWVISRSMAATRAAADELRDLSARQEAIFDAATDGMITHDPKGIIESLNPAAASMYGYEMDELVGQSIGVLFDQALRQEELEVFLADLAQNPEKGAAKVRQFRAKRRDGSLFTVDVALSPVPLQDGLHFIVVIRDVTERWRVEKMKTEFVSTVSHELRTPLTSIAGSLGLLTGGAAGELPQRAASLIKIAHSNSERLVRLINDILDIEKIESGKMSFDIKPVALTPLVEQVIEANQAYAAEYGVALTLEAADETASVLADPDRLVQVLTNLISNAAKFSPRGEEVVIALATGVTRHRISVIDKGRGIPEAFKDRIFSKFAQADSSDTREKGGTGLGLSIVQQIVAGLGGTISFGSEQGSGTVFHVDLPAAPEPKQSPRRARILICQEDPAAADEVKRSLRKAGFDSDIAANSEEVRTLTGHRAYAAILLDLALPGEEAISLIGDLRSNPGYAHAPILIAAADGTGDVSQALAVVDWIHKPVSLTKLMENIQDKVPGGERPSILHVEDDPDVLRVVAGAFEGHADVHSVVDLEAARAALNQDQCDLVILDLALPGGSGLELLPDLRRPDGSLIPVVIFSAQDDDPALARQVEAVLTKSRASLNDLVATVEALLANPRPAGGSQ